MNKCLSLLIAVLFVTLFSYSQAPGIFNYQGIARNSVGNVLENKTITLRLSIHDISSTGPVVYQESRTVTTNPFGLFNVQIGSAGANNVTGSIPTVNWATGNKYLQVEIDPSGGNTFINLGTSQLASVPYALNSGDNYWRRNGNDIYKINSGNVGIGTNTPLANLHIKNNFSASLMIEGINGANESRIQFNDPTGNNSGLIYSGGDMSISQRGGRVELLASSVNNNTFGWLTLRPEGNVGISTPAPHPSSKLEIASNNSGLLIPRMTESQRNAINIPANGLMIYQTDNMPGFYFFDGTVWTKLATGGAVTNFWAANGNHIYNTNSGRIGIGINTPLAALHIKSTTILPLILEGPTPTIQFFNPGGVFRGSIGQGANTEMSFNSTDHTLFYTNGNLQMAIASDGNVGIGLGGNLPNYKLTVESAGPGIVHTSSGRRFGTSSTVPTGNSTLGGGFFGTFSNDALGFFTNNLLHMTILQNGNVGIGTFNPSTKLHINKNDEALRLSGNDSYMTFYDGNSYKGFLGAADNDIELGTPNSNTTGKVVFYRKGVPLLSLEANTDFPNYDLVRIGAIGAIRFTQAGPPKLSLQGGTLSFKKPNGDQAGEWGIGYNLADDNMGVYFNGGIKGFFANTNGKYIDLSDSRLKENFESYKPVLKEIRKLNVLIYSYKADKTHDRTLGLVAQNVKQYFPELVVSSGGKDNFLGIDYAATGVLAIKAIQEQQVIIESLEKKIETLEKRLAALESKLR